MGPYCGRRTSARLGRNSLVVWLKADAPTLQQRIGQDATTARRRPSLTGLTGLEEIRHLLAVREPLYRQAAQIELDTEQVTPREVAGQIVGHVRRRLDDTSDRQR